MGANAGSLAEAINARLEELGAGDDFLAEDIDREGWISLSAPLEESPDAVCYGPAQEVLEILKASDSWKEVWPKLDAWLAGHMGMPEDEDSD